MLQLSSPILPLLDSSVLDQPLAGAISRSSALLIPLHLLEKVKPTISANQPYFVLLPNQHASSSSSSSNSISPETVADILDQGADAIVTDDLHLIHSFDQQTSASRLIYSTPNLDSQEIAQVVAGVLLTTNDHGAVTQTVSTLGSKTNGKPVFVSLSSSSTSSALPSTQDVIAIAALGAALVVVTSSLCALDDGQEAVAGKLDYIDAFLAPLKSDRADKLFATVVVSSACSTSLGLVYSSPLSIRKSLLTGSAHYQSRNRGLWHKGETSGATQEVVSVRQDCDNDALEFRVRQSKGTASAGFCHLGNREGCFSSASGLAKLESTLRERKQSAPAGSYTARLFSDPSLLGAKLREEAAELADAKNEDTQHVAFEAADLLYFALTKCVSAGIGLEEIERSLDAKSKKVTRRKGDAKEKFAKEQKESEQRKEGKAESAKPPVLDADAPIKIKSYRLSEISASQRIELLKRPSIKTEAIMGICKPILKSIKERGDAALLELTAKFDKAQLETPIRLPPFANEEVIKQIRPDVVKAIDQAYSNIHAFHKAQKVTSGNKAVGPTDKSGDEEAEDAILEVETMPGVVCRRFSRPIERVGLYVPGGTAVLPSTALMLGIPAQVAKCSTKVIATPPRPDGSIAPEVLYVADKVGATHLLCAGGAQAVGAMAYGTETCPKVDKIAGPGNQFVTAAKMIVQNETDTLVSIDMPAGPSEVLVIADGEADPAFVASDLLSQAEHGPDSQVVLVGIDLSDDQLLAIEKEVDSQARRLPRVDIVRQAIDKSVTVITKTREEAMDWSNDYAPEHLIIQTQYPEEMVNKVKNAGSVFVGAFTPESCGDLASGTNHVLPTYGFARTYSGVSVSTFQKNITSQQISTSGLGLLGPHVVNMAECEGLEAHANAVRVRLQKLSSSSSA
ncbi:putative histidine biosynthesis trifunctional protein [Violaceomyces palustris]|uniref:Histidine biosynthesis trifunctional protein n=1 Tax=Violaceomyces palustris TaxID=1673888 RepID=A0ACD0NS70_9BASI|nr:putative histidine biosynthesis trifunctional protein [Violaceomyces palustris]